MKPAMPEHRGVHIKPRASLALVVGVLIAALIAYFGVTRGLAAQSTSPPQPQPASVHIVRIPGNTPTFKIVPLDRTITNTSQAQHLYYTILSLPASCNSGAYTATLEAYMLTFYRNGQAILTARAGFCGGVDLDRGNPKDTPAFRYRQGVKLPQFDGQFSVRRHPLFG